MCIAGRQACMAGMAGTRYKCWHVVYVGKRAGMLQARRHNGRQCVAGRQWHTGRQRGNVAGRCKMEQVKRNERYPRGSVMLRGIGTRAGKTPRRVTPARCARGSPVRKRGVRCSSPSFIQYAGGGTVAATQRQHVPASA